MPDDYLTSTAQPGPKVRRDTDTMYVPLTVARRARDEAAATVIAQVRCQTCQGRGTVEEGAHDCPGCAGVGIDPDVTFADLLPADHPAAGSVAARAVDAERARLRRIFSGWHDRLTPPRGEADANFMMALRVVIGEIDDDRSDETPQALTVEDLHRLARWPEHDADMLEAGDHRDPNYQIAHEDSERAAGLRALAARARQHLGSPMYYTPGDTDPRTVEGEPTQHG